MGQRIVLVGHCGVDAPRLETEIARYLRGAEVLTINSEMALEEVCEEGADLLLINRELPYGFEEEEGLEMLRNLQHIHPNLRMMLVSDRADAQKEAKEAGAVPGFGKADLGTGKVKQVLKQALN